MLFWYRTIERTRDKIRCAIEGDRACITRQFTKGHGYPPDLDNPNTFNEKKQWIKLHDHNPLYTRCSDKYLMREFVAEVVGEQHLVPLLGVYDDARKIDFDALPAGFAIKANHGSGWNLIIRDKNKDFDRRAVVTRCNKWLAKNYYVNNREWQYKNIKPLLVVEELLLDSRGELPADYKIHCFDHGRADVVIGVIHGRFANCKHDIYDERWRKLDVSFNYPQSEEGVPRPEPLPEMVGLARRLAEPFPYVRVDLYVLGDRIYVGELTLTPGSGYHRLVPESTDLEWGSRFQVQAYSP